MTTFLILASFLASWLCLLNIPAYAATSDYYAQYEARVFYFSSKNDDWDEVLDAQTADGVGDASFPHFSRSGIGGQNEDWSYQWVGYKVLASTLNADSIESATFYVWNDNTPMENEHFDASWGLYTWHNTTQNITSSAYSAPKNEQANVPQIDDYYGFLDSKLTSQFTTGAWQQYHITGDALKYIKHDINGFIWFALCMDEIMSNSPLSIDMEAMSVGDLSYPDDLKNDAQHNAYLHITYVPGAPPQSPTLTPTYVPPTASPTPNSSVTSISWLTPRCAYGDGVVWFDILGSPSYILSLQLIDENSQVIKSQAATIGADGHYYWLLSAPGNNIDTVARCYEVNSGKFSPWGYIAPKPSTVQEINSMNVVDTVHPQYTYAFSRFMTQKGNMMFVHWKTNMDWATTNTTHYLRLEHMGEPNDLLYDNNFLYLLNYYWLCDDTYSAGMTAWRYAIFTMDGGASGFESYDDLIIDLAQTPGNYSYGFYVPTIWDISATPTPIEFTEPQGAYFYIPTAADGITLSLTKSSYTTSQIPTVQLSVGVKSGCFDYLPDITIEALLDGEVPAGNNTDTLISSPQTLALENPIITAGSYIMRITLSGDNSYSYIHDIPFTVGTSGGGTGTGTGPTDWIRSQLEPYGLNNDFGTWMLVMVLMVIMFLIFSNDRVWRVIMPLLAFGLGIVAGFINAWILAILAGIAGWLIFRFIFRRT